ncbi:scyllo-inosose 3-dehydrogenase [Candidatus Magnetominusculus xianensis]|uniref:Alcohol dehydrogenase n=1 Tax=Candidatus Magnetominusculus xianensis TaxID=1748249 RepID=A0ABR5SG00_9BACT|nr:scyllo-inosose 3-dehydrogenase [Candidatus Magnetominusculus xianensis]KWT78183.1 alcohol dehydrogenase [Candidatus Magnetominusculus xianensis]MBF0404680.1 alcohol dehydrogenase catalytic domain-containing protein [Nitrospirota bacterium]
MKAFVADGQWAPKDGYTPTKEETTRKRAVIGSSVWRNPTFELKSLPTPNITDDELLIAVKRCGICGSDTHLYETTPDGYIQFSGPVSLPQTIGHEYSGVVVKKGRSVRNFKEGDMVAVESIHWCGICTPCRSGAFNQCENVELIGITAPGALAEFIAAKERHCWNINSLRRIYSEDDIYDLGALVEPVGCAYNGIFIGGGGIKPGMAAAVFGVGPIGLAAVALSRLAGANVIVAFDIENKRLDIAKSLGADYVFNVNDLKKDGISPRQKIMELTDGYGAELQVEAAGAARLTVPEMENSLAVNGKLIYLGRSATSAEVMLDCLVTGANSIIGVRGHSGYGIYNNIIRLLSTGRLQIKGMITSYYDFSETLTALEKSVERQDAKCMIRIG